MDGERTVVLQFFTHCPIIPLGFSLERWLFNERSSPCPSGYGVQQGNAGKGSDVDTNLGYCRRKHKVATVQIVGWCSDITKHSARSALQVTGFADRVSQPQLFPMSR